MDLGKSSIKIIDRVLFAVVLGCTAGILCASLFRIPLFISKIVCVIAGIALIGRARFPGGLLVSLVLFSFVFGVTRYQLSVPDGSAFDQKVGTTVTLRGIIHAEPARTERSQSFVLKYDGVGILVSTKIEASSLSYGDEVAVSGKLERPENFLTEQAKEFDYVSYLYKDSILYRMSFADVVVLSRGNGNVVVSKLLRFKQALEQSFSRVFSPVESGLLSGILLGTKSSIPSTFRADLIETGTIHIIALSGYNVSIIARAFRTALENLSLSPGVASIGGGLGILLFVLMTGMQATAVRAGIMAIVALIARRAGRTYDAFRALLFAGIGMILWNPKLLAYDVSFQLSFIATLGIIFITPLFERMCIRVPKKVLWIFPLREMLAVTLGAQVAVLPLILYKMGVLSFIALPVNLVILPVVPLVMGLGALAGVIGIVSPLLAYPIAWCTERLLKYIIATVEFSASVPYASITLRQFPLWLALVSYGILFAWVYLQQKKSDERTSFRERF